MFESNKRIYDVIARGDLGTNFGIQKKKNKIPNKINRDWVCLNQRTKKKLQNYLTLIFSEKDPAISSQNHTMISLQMIRTEI